MPDRSYAMPKHLETMRQRLARKPADPAYVGGGSIVLNRAMVEALVEIAEAAVAVDQEWWSLDDPHVVDGSGMNALSVLNHSLRKLGDTDLKGK